jgi:ferrochelatase
LAPVTAGATPGARIAVILFNLGGPDGPGAIEPFLFNLFNDRAIIDLPGPLRWLVAKLIARRRALTARQIYDKIGGRSPILPNTEAQAAALTARLTGLGEVRVWPCMRYWNPLTPDVVREVAAFRPSRIVLLPLYPQFSTTTTASSFDGWMKAARAAGIDAPTHRICCYPTEPGLITALAALVQEGLRSSGDRPTRVLFSAHGLPRKIVERRGDPYPAHVAATAVAVAQAAGLKDGQWLVCYQSRVGPLEWIGPSTEESLRSAGRDGVSVVVVPIAFVSEHSETLVELDIEYRHLAEQAGIPNYVRVRTVGVLPTFIDGLAGLVRKALTSADKPVHGGMRRPCERGTRSCPCEMSTST